MIYKGNKDRAFADISGRGAKNGKSFTIALAGESCTKNKRRINAPFIKYGCLFNPSLKNQGGR